MGNVGYIKKIMKKIHLLGLFFIVLFHLSLGQNDQIREIKGKCVKIEQKIDTISSFIFTKVIYSILTDEDTIFMIKRNNPIIKIKKAGYIMLHFPQWNSCYIYEGKEYYIKMRSVCWESEKSKYSINDSYNSFVFKENNCNELIPNKYNLSTKKRKRRQEYSGSNVIDIDNRLYQIILMSPCPDCRSCPDFNGG